MILIIVILQLLQKCPRRDFRKKPGSRLLIIVNLIWFGSADLYCLANNVKNKNSVNPINIKIINYTPPIKKPNEFNKIKTLQMLEDGKRLFEEFEHTFE